MNEFDREAAITALDALGDDPEGGHIDADRILIHFLHAHGYSDVADAWNRAAERVGFWYA